MINIEIKKIIEFMKPVRNLTKKNIKHKFKNNLILKDKIKKISILKIQ